MLFFRGVRGSYGAFFDGDEEKPRAHELCMSELCFVAVADILCIQKRYIQTHMDIYIYTVYILCTHHPY